MRKLLTASLAVALIGLVAAPMASAKERLLTLYSPKIRRRAPAGSASSESISTTA